MTSKAPISAGATKVEITAEPTVDLSQVRVAYADSRAAVDFARRLNLPADVCIKTLSPALILSGDSKIVAADGHMADNDGQELGQDSLRLCQAMYEIMLGEPEFAEAAVAVAQIGVLFPTLSFISMAIPPEDHTSDVAVIRTTSNRPVDPRSINIPWEELLQANPKLVVIDAPPVEFDDNFRERPETIDFVGRQLLGGWEKIGFQIIQKIWNRLPFSSPRGTFLILRENPLLRETALSLAHRGYGLRTLPVSPTAAMNIDLETAARIKSILSPALESFLRHRISEVGKPRLREIFTQQVLTALARFRSGKEYWAKTLDDVAGSNPKAILTNMLMTPETAALHVISRSRGVPLAAFQHGVAREISHSNYFIQAYFEGNTADYFYAFDPASSEVTRACTFNQSETIPVGLPSLYRRTGRYRRRNPSAPPILYASTQLYGMGINMAAGRSVSDATLARAELALLERVFDKIPHDVLYKPYPVARYLDPDPVLAHASKMKNLTVFQDGDDLRFLLAGCRIALTSRATSTLGWCVASKKPLVFIDYPSQSPLRVEARKAMEDAFFVFDAGVQYFLERLAEFLSQPMIDIEKQWEEKAAARQLVIKQYFDHGDGAAGARAARHLLSAISARHRQSDNAIRFQGE